MGKKKDPKESKDGVIGRIPRGKPGVWLKTQFYHLCALLGILDEVLAAEKEE